MLRDGLLTAESSQRGYVLTGNEVYLAPYENAKLVAEVELDKVLKSLVSRSEWGAMLQRLEAVTREKIIEMDASIALKRNGLEAEALAIIQTNRGKALLDEANVFLSAIALRADEELTNDVSEQTANATWLRWTAIAGGFLILALVTGVIVTVLRYTREIIEARDQVRRANEGLEARVAQRTEELSRARDRAELLLDEVNHRVANSLSLVASLVRLQARTVGDEATKSVLDETRSRIEAIAQMHKHLFTSGDVSLVQLDEYLATLVSQLETSVTSVGSGVSVRCIFEPVQINTNDSINLGIIVTEWVTNALKYAYPGRDGEVRVRLAPKSQGFELAVEDDGKGRIDGAPATGTGLGTRIVSTIAAAMNATVEYRSQSPGMSARLLVPSIGGRAG